MRTAYAEWWFDYGREGGGWVRYGTDRDPFVCVPKDADPDSIGYRLGYVYAEDTRAAMDIDEEVFGHSA